MDGTIEIWKWIASALLIVLGWLVGRQDGKKSAKTEETKDGWNVERQATLLRIKQLEDLTNQRSEHPEYHPLANYMNGRLGDMSNRLDIIERDIRSIQRGDDA